MFHLARHREPASRLLVISALAACAALFLSARAEAARVAKIEGPFVVLELEGDAIEIGDEVLLMDGAKKRALVQITKANDKRAVGRVLKGSAQIGNIAKKTAPRAGSRGDRSGSRTSSRAGRSSRGGDSSATKFGAVVGYSMQSQTVSIPNSAGEVLESVALTGSGFSGKLAIDLPIAGRVGLIGRFGVEQFNLTGTSTGSNCNKVKNCTTTITYASGDMLIRYAFTEGSFVPYLSGGLGIHFPLSKSSNVLTDASITTTTIFFGGGGFYARLSPTLFLPLHAEYGLFPPSNSVSSSIIAVRTGLMFAF